MKTAHNTVNFALALLLAAVASVVSAEPQRTASSTIDLLSEQITWVVVDDLSQME